MPAAPCFELSIRSAEDPASDLLGLWASPVGDPARYAAAGEPTRWMVHLPTDPALAMRVLATADEDLTASLRRLPVAKDKLAAVLDPEPTWAFNSQRSDAEGMLAAWLYDDQISYDTGAAGRRVTPAMLGDCAAFIDRIRTACSPTAVIETLSGDRLVGRSRLALDGNAGTVVRSDRGANDTRLHGQAVALAASSRVALVRVLGLAARAAVAISVRLVLPGGPLLALGPALRFVHDVVARR
jgi:hypothetical protein